jgi:hypothetical protein
MKMILVVEGGVENRLQDVLDGNFRRFHNEKKGQTATKAPPDDSC